MAVVNYDGLLQHLRNQANAQIKAGQVYITVNGQQVPATATMSGYVVTSAANTVVQVHDPRTCRLYWNNYAMRFEATSPKGLLIAAAFGDNWRVTDNTSDRVDYMSEQRVAEAIAEWLEII